MFDDAERTDVAYYPILAVTCLAHFHHSLMCIDGYSASGSSYRVMVNCYCMGVGCDDVCVQSQLGLRSRRLVTTKQGHIQHTLKT